MRIVISILSLVLLGLIVNIIAYTMSEDYRFFLKKLKYSQEVVTDTTIIDDQERYVLAPSQDSSGEVVVGSEKIDDTIFFLDVLKNHTTKEPSEKQIPDMFRAEQEVLNLFEEKFVLTQLSDISAPLFGLTTEYPDEYREFTNNILSLYMFPTKSYDEIQRIFEILSYDIPYTLNKVNNFGQASLYINIDEGMNDDFVRILFEYQNLAFGLKIKKDSYNEAKMLLETL